MYKKKMAADIRCPLEYGLEVFGGKWKSRILCVLAATLKELLGSGMIQRRSYDEIPPRVEYSLTDKGHSVVPILQSICRWAGQFSKENKTEHPMTQCEKCDYR